MCYLSVSEFSTPPFYRSVCLCCDVVNNHVSLMFLFFRKMNVHMTKQMNKLLKNIDFMDHA